MSDYTPEEAEFIDTYVSAMSGGCTPIEDPERATEARRGIAKVKADALREAKDSVLTYDGSSFLRYLKETDRAIVEQWLHECATKIEGEA